MPIDIKDIPQQVTLPEEWTIVNDTRDSLQEYLYTDEYLQENIRSLIGFILDVNLDGINNWLKSMLPDELDYTQVPEVVEAAKKGFIKALHDDMGVYKAEMILKKFIPDKASVFQIAEYKEAAEHAFKSHIERRWEDELFTLVSHFNITGTPPNIDFKSILNEIFLEHIKKSEFHRIDRILEMKEVMEVLGISIDDIRNIDGFDEAIKEACTTHLVNNGGPDDTFQKIYTLDSKGEPIDYPSVATKAFIQAIRLGRVVQAEKITQLHVSFLDKEPIDYGHLNDLKEAIHFGYLDALGDQDFHSVNLFKKLYLNDEHDQTIDYDHIDGLREVCIQVFIDMMKSGQLTDSLEFMQKYTNDEHDQPIDYINLPEYAARIKTTLYHSLTTDDQLSEIDTLIDISKDSNLDDLLLDALPRSYIGHANHFLFDEIDHDEIEFIKGTFLPERGDARFRLFRILSIYVTALVRENVRKHLNLSSWDEITSLSQDQLNQLPILNKTEKDKMIAKLDQIVDDQFLNAFRAHYSDQLTEIDMNFFASNQ